jgi:hypothetical protein
MERQKYLRFSNSIMDEMISKAKYEINPSNYQNISKISAGIRPRLNELVNCVLGEFFMNLILPFHIYFFFRI